jgi:hypothetical protein
MVKIHFTESDWNVLVGEGHRHWERVLNFLANACMMEVVIFVMLKLFGSHAAWTQQI